MSTIRVAIAGATGYAGEELLRLLVYHPSVRLTYLAASAKWEQPVAAGRVFPRLARSLDLPIEALDPSRLIRDCAVAVPALPPGASMALLPELLKAGKRVIDLGADFRLRDPSSYPRWYKVEHPHPELLGDARIVYGLTEFYREQIAKAQVVANPGCYATSVLLGVLPLFRAGLIPDGRFVVDAKSGLSGAGRKADMSLLFTEMAENLRAYKVNEHQHMPEGLQEITRLTGKTGQMVFVPQVIPATRGLVSMIHVRSAASSETVLDAYRTSYPSVSTPFVRVRTDALPQLRDVIGTNFCDIGVSATPSLESVVVVSALDNLTKGAAGQAIQNFNVMHGVRETEGLDA